MFEIAMRPTALTLLLAIGTLAAPARAAEDPFRHQVKRIKTALVAIEHRIDRATTELDELSTRSDTLQSAISTAQERIAGDSTSGFARGIVTVAGITLLQSARRELTLVQAQIASDEQEIATGTDARERRVDELQRIVVRKQEEERGFSNWTLGGSLITYSADWEKVSDCESSGRWHIDAQFDGGLQFHPRTWLAFGGGEFGRYAYEATKRQQIAIAERVLAIQGPGAWPNCYRPLPVGF